MKQEISIRLSDVKNILKIQIYNLGVRPERLTEYERGYHNGSLEIARDIFDLFGLTVEHSEVTQILKELRAQ